MPVLIFVLLASLGALYMVAFLTVLWRDGSDLNPRHHSYSAPASGAGDLYPLSGVPGRGGAPVARKIFTMPLVTPTVSARHYSATEKPGRVQARSR